MLAVLMVEKKDSKLVDLWATLRVDWLAESKAMNLVDKKADS